MKIVLRLLVLTSGYIYRLLQIPSQTYFLFPTNSFHPVTADFILDQNNFPFIWIDYSAAVDITEILIS